jgi:hypothetical protein
MKNSFTTIKFMRIPLPTELKYTWHPNSIGFLFLHFFNPINQTTLFYVSVNSLFGAIALFCV